MERIPFCSPSISERDVQYVADSVPHCATIYADEFQHRFEDAFAEYLGVRHAFAVSSRTAAIHVALAALGVRAGHEVIVPDVLPASSLMPVRYLAATTVFADIDQRSWCLSADSFRQSITPRTRAVMPVDLHGAIPEMHRIRAIARARGIAIVEDASDAVGGEFLGRRAGSLGDVGVFGFDRTETLTTVEGGMVVTNCDRLAAAVEESLCKSGFDYSITPMQAALAVAQLERIDDLVARKRQIETWYRQALANVRGITFTESTPGSQCVPSEVNIVIDPAVVPTNEIIVEELGLRGIECRPMFPPASSLAAYADSIQARVARGRNRVSYAVSPCGVSLPSGTNLARREIEDVVVVLRDVIERHSTPRPLLKRAA